MQLGITEALDLAITHFDNGKLVEAEYICQNIVNADQNNADAINLLGLIALERKRSHQAEPLFARAIAINPSVPAFYNNLGSLYQDQYQYGKAEAYYRKALELIPGHPEILINLSGVLIHLNKHEEAFSVLNQALEINPNNALALTNLGDLYQNQLQFDRAIQCYQQALEFNSDHINAWVNLGVCFELQHELKLAEDCFRQVLTLNPGHGIALNNLGNIFRKEKRINESVDCYERAIAIDPNFAPAYHNLGLALAELNAFDDAIASMRNAISIQPGYVEPYYSLGDLLAEHGKISEAHEIFDAGYKVNHLPGLKVRQATLLPVINESAGSIEATRRDFEIALTELEQDPGLRLTDPLHEVRDACFYLSYHGINNRDLKIKIAGLFEKACPSLLWEAPHCSLPRNNSDRIKVGIISKYMSFHSIGRTTSGLVAKLPRDRFQIYAIFVGSSPQNDLMSQFIKENADVVLEIHDHSLELARQQIAALELDILFYQDISMEPFTYFLAFSRLAPVQCTSFGHPDTTGIRNMDYFVSTELFEGQNAQEHYSEKLFLLHDVGTPAYYYRMPLSGNNHSRSYFGLSDANHLYLCPQTLFKFHPGFDQIMGDILRGDPLGQIILLEGKIPHLVTMLRQRLNRVIPDVAHRVTFLPHQNFLDFLRLIEVSDVMLDIQSYNGMNSTLDAFLVGTPVVTFPGQLQRTRHGYAMYQKMGITACVAESKAHYVEISLRLANDSPFRQEVSQAILAKNHLLFEDEHVITEFSRFFEEAVAGSATKPATLP